MGHNPDAEVVEFPTTQEEVEQRNSLTPEQIAQMDEKGVGKVLELIDKNKENGIKMMQNSVDQKRVPHYSEDAGMKHIENTVRVLEKGIQGALTSVEAINSLVDLIRHDMVAMVNNLQQQQQAAVTNNTQVNVLLQLLDNKGIITEDELRETFRQLAQKHMDQENQGS